MAQIQAKWPKSGQNLGIGGHNIGLRGQNNVPRARIGVFWVDHENVLIFLSQIYLSYIYDVLNYFVLHENVLILS